MSRLVRHVMTAAPQTLGPSSTAADAAGTMSRYDVGVVPVTDSEGLLGLVTDRDIVVRVVADRRDPAEVQLGSIVTRTPVTVTPDASLSDARDLMSEHRVRRLPVVKANRLVGILSLGDLAVADPSRRAIGDTLEAVSESASTTHANDDPDRGASIRVRS
jgi:CBS domain-containing protein